MLASRVEGVSARRERFLMMSIVISKSKFQYNYKNILFYQTIYKQILVINQQTHNYSQFSHAML